MTNLVFGDIIVWDYDVGGNILYKKVYSLATDINLGTCEDTLTYTYKSEGWRDRLDTFDGKSCTYDAMGNPTTYLGNTLTWTKVRRLASFGSNTFEYGANGIRYKKNDTVYTLDGNKILRESDGTKTLTYYHGGSGIVGFAYNGTDYYFRKNLQGDVTEIYTSAGLKVASYVYDAWGKVLAVNNLTTDNIGDINPIRYRSYYYDVETGLYYLNSRYYDPETGRFINSDTTDILENAQYDINGLNLYAYCDNNPVAGRDGVVTDDNGLIYMRARYYSPEMKRFINADIVAGKLSNAITLNRFAYANGNPVSFVDPFGLWSLKGAWNSFTNWVSDTANDVKDWAVDTTNDVKDWAVDTYNDAKDAVVKTYNEVKDWAIDTANDVKNWAVDTYSDAKQTVKDAATWVDTNVIKPAGKALANAGRQIKDGFTTVANAISDNVGAKVSAGKEKTLNTDYYYFATVEEGIGYSKDFGNEKPITFYASAGENWWEFWEWSVGIDVNINGYGAGISIGTDTSINVHAGDVSHEVGVNALGRISHKVAYNVGDGYAYSKYSLNGPETALAVVGVAALIYYAPALIPAIGAGAPALAGAMG